MQKTGASPSAPRINGWGLVASTQGQCDSFAGQSHVPENYSPDDVPDRGFLLLVAGEG